MSSLNVVPQELDWVSKRAECTIGQVFNKLCNEIEGDLSAINAARNLSDMDRFHMDKVGDGRTIIVGQPSRFPRVVVKIGVVSENEIEVRDEVTQSSWRVGMGLNNHGRCVLKNGDEEMEHWQFRKKALEPLFFGPAITT